MRVLPRTDTLCILGQRRLQRPEEAVAGIAETGEDVGIFDLECSPEIRALLHFGDTDGKTRTGRATPDSSGRPPR